MYNHKFFVVGEVQPRYFDYWRRNSWNFLQPNPSAPSYRIWWLSSVNLCHICFFCRSGKTWQRLGCYSNHGGKQDRSSVQEFLLQLQEEVKPWSHCWGVQGSGETETLSLVCCVVLVSDIWQMFILLKRTLTHIMHVFFNTFLKIRSQDVMLPISRQHP